MKQIIKNILRPVVSPIYRMTLMFLGRYFPKTLAGILYKRIFNKKLDWENPCDINEKINWLKFYSDTSQWTILADKYRVREYVKSCGLGHMLVKLYGKWDNVEDIDWEKLPNKFIMKTNNGSGDVFICENRALLDIKSSTNYFNRLMHNEFGYNMAEPHYNKIKPCIIAEELLDNKKQQIESSSIIDYKIWSFDGKPAYIWACYNRTPYSVEVGVYDSDWNFYPQYSKITSHYILGKYIPKPKSLEKMIEAAAILSKGFPQVRVDLYEVDEKPYFGEMTFTAAGGFNDFYSGEFLQILGDMTKI